MPATTPAAERALERTFEAAMAAAGRALGEMSGQEIRVVASEVARTSAGSVIDAVGGAERLVVGVYLGITGSLTGHAMLVLPPDGARRLAELLLDGLAEVAPAPAESLEFDELELSALREVGNVTIAAFLNEVGGVLAEPVHPTVPIAVADMAGAILDGVIADLAMDDDRVLAARTRFVLGSETIEGALLVLPHGSSLAILAVALGVA